MPSVVVWVLAVLAGVAWPGSDRWWQAVVELRQREMIVAAYAPVPMEVCVRPHVPSWENHASPFARLLGFDVTVQRPYSPARIWLSDERQCSGVVEERWIWLCRAMIGVWEPFGLPDCFPMERRSWRCLLEAGSLRDIATFLDHVMSERKEEKRNGK